MMKTTHNPKRVSAGKQATAKTESSTVSAAAFEKFLRGIRFPINKQGIITHLMKNRATDQVLDIAEHFSEKDYASVAEVAREFSYVKKS